MILVWSGGGGVGEESSSVVVWERDKTSISAERSQHNDTGVGSRTNYKKVKVGAERMRGGDGKDGGRGTVFGNMNRTRMQREIDCRVRAARAMLIPSTRLGKLIQRITKRTFRVTEAWTDGRHAVDDKYVELDYELAVALANVTEVATRSTVLKVTQVEPSYGFVACQALLGGYAPKSSNDPAIALHTCAS